MKRLSARQVRIRLFKAGRYDQGFINAVVKMVADSELDYYIGESDDSSNDILELVDK